MFGCCFFNGIWYQFIWFHIYNFMVVMFVWSYFLSYTIIACHVMSVDFVVSYQVVFCGKINWQVQDWKVLSLQITRRKKSLNGKNPMFSYVDSWCQVEALKGRQQTSTVRFILHCQRFLGLKIRWQDWVGDDTVSSCKSSSSLGIFIMAIQNLWEFLLNRWQTWWD